MKTIYSPFRMYINLLKIEKSADPWLVRTLFLFLTVINAGAYLNPWIDTDFGPIYAWMDSINNLSDPSQLTPEMMQVPWTRGTLLAVLLPMAADLITFICSLLYMAIQLRSSRKKAIAYYQSGEYEKDMADLPAGLNICDPVVLAPPPVSRLAGRILLLLLILGLLFVPLVFGAIIFFFLVIIALPVLVAFPAAFIAGDLKISEIIPFLIRRSRNIYSFNARNLVFLLAANFAVGFIVGIFANFEAMTPVYYVLTAAASSWFTIVFANFSLGTYSAMQPFHFKDSPLNIYREITKQKGKEE